MGCMSSRTKGDNEGNIFIDSTSRDNKNLSRSNLKTEEVFTTLNDMDDKEAENPIWEQDGGIRTPSKSQNLELGTPMFSVSLSALQHCSEPNWSTECHADYSCGASFLEALRLCDAEMEMTPECSRKCRDYGKTPTYTGKKIYNNLSNPDFSCGKKILI